MAESPYMAAAAIRTAVGAPLDDEDTYTDDDLEALIAEFENIAEQYLGQAFTARESATETRWLVNSRTLKVTWPNVVTVNSIAITDTAGTVTTLTSADWSIMGDLPLIDLGGYYTGTAAIDYDHGPATAADPRPALLRACREYVRACVLADKSSVPRDIVYEASADGYGTRYADPDPAKGRPTGYRVVDRLLNSIPSRHRQGIA